MNIAVIGSNSFIAREIILSEYFSSERFLLYGIENDLNPHHFTLFKYPENPIEFSTVSEADVVIYCAGAGIQANLNESNSLIYNLNTFIPIQLYTYLEEIRYGGIVITFGSYFEIGDSSESKTFSEKQVIYSQYQVPNDYCVSKRLLSRFIDSKNIKTKYFHIYLPNIYSKSENPLRIIPYVINGIKERLELEFTEGSQMRQYLHVEDLTRFIHFIIKEKEFPGGFYNLAPDENHSVKEVVSMIFEVLNEPLNENLFGRKVGRDETMKHLSISNEKVKRYGFCPEIDLESGIRKYL